MRATSKLTKLTNLQIRYLRGLAHPQQFIVQTGEKGLSVSVQNAIAEALAIHELIKVKLNAERDERKQMTEAIITEQQCLLIQQIGKVIVLYKRHPEQPKIDLS